MTSDVVEVHLFAAARSAVGQSSVQVQADTLGALLDQLEQRSPAFSRVRPQCSYLVDGLTVHDDPAKVALVAGQRVDVLPPFAGG